MPTSTKAVLDHHLSAFRQADPGELMKDYTEASEILTPQGPLKGLAAIRDFYEGIFNIFPKGSALEVSREIVRDKIAYIAWSGESTFVTMPLGTDTFMMEDDKIVYQTLAAQIIPK